MKHRREKSGTFIILLLSFLLATNLAIFRLFTKNIYDLCAFDLKKSAICYILFILSFLLGILTGLWKKSEHNIVGVMIMFVVNLLSWTRFFFNGWSYYAELFLNGYISKSSFVHLRIILAINLLGGAILCFVLLWDRGRLMRK